MVVQNSDDVLQLLASLFIDTDHVAKTLQCSNSTETIRQLTRLTVLLSRSGPPTSQLDVDGFNAATKKALAQASRGEIEGLLIRGGIDAQPARLISNRYVSLDAVRKALKKCPIGGRARFFSPLLATWAGTAATKAYMEGRRGTCDEVSEDCVNLLTDGATSNVIDLGSDDEDDDVVVTGGAPGVPRLLHYELSQKLGSHERFDPSKEPDTHQVKRFTIADGARWVQLWSSQGGLRTHVYTVHLIDSGAVKAAISRVLKELSGSELNALAQSEANAGLADAASRVAKVLVEEAEGALPYNCLLYTSPSPRDS